MQFQRLSKFPLPPTEDLPGPAHIPPQAAATSASRPLLQRLESIETISHATHPYRRSPGGGLAQENLQPQTQHSPMQLTEHSSQRSDPKCCAVCATSSWPFRFAGVLLPAFILALFCVGFFLFFGYVCVQVQMGGKVRLADGKAQAEIWVCPKPGMAVAG